MRLPKLILASGSPRRGEILRSVGWEYEKRPADVDESVLEEESADEYVLRLALKKAEAVACEADGGLVLGADTIVVLDGDIVGKPDDQAHAREMISSLSGKWHEVKTGVAVVYRTPRREYESDDEETIRAAGARSTRVRFSELSAAEVEFLVRHGDPLDKAGAYAVQAQAALFIDRIEGDYWNVVGLPVSLVYELCSEIGDAWG